MYDFYLLWLGRSVLDRASPDARRKLIDVLVEKIQRRHKVKGPPEVIEELCAMSIERLGKSTAYSASVMREDPTAPGMMIIDWEKWQTMREWIKNRSPNAK